MNPLQQAINTIEAIGAAKNSRGLFSICDANEEGKTMLCAGISCVNCIFLDAERLEKGIKYLKAYNLIEGGS